MRQENADLVYPVLEYGLRLKGQLARGEEGLNLLKEQAALKGLLKSETEAKRWNEFSGDPVRSVAGRGSIVDGFLGMRYALVCWLDEIFILDSSWKTEWSENKLEAALYGSNDRAFRFWEQARRAEGRPEPDALEVYYLCVMLGFRGDLSGTPEKLQSWRDAAEAHLKQREEVEWPGPVEVPPPTDVPPLTGLRRQQSALTLLGAAVLILIPVAVFFVVWQLGRS